jgi:hypothetical protein
MSIWLQSTLNLLAVVSTEGKGKGGKRDGDGNNKGNGKGGKGDGNGN